jgi:bifunctional non-homologous end joining protein LigD
VSRDPLKTYRSKRDAARTPEPVPPPGPLPSGHDDIFVIQEHHASSLHWDFRLERDGVLVSWALPKGLPVDPASNHLAVPTEDHPMEYASFEGEIGPGEYGAGKVTIWDAGTYETEKWTDREVKVVLHGRRAQGRYVLFPTGPKNWMIHRMDPLPAGFEPLPATIPPMMAVLRDTLPPDDGGWAYEMKWDGVRAIVHVDGGRPRVMSRNDNDMTAAYPELREMAESLGSLQAVLDGEIVALDRHGKPSFAALQPRMHVTDAAQIRRLQKSTPVTFMAFDVLHLDGRSTLDLPYEDRRRLLESLELEGPSWRTPPAWYSDGESVLAAAAEQGLEGIIAKRRDSPYRPGRRSDSWVKVKHLRTQEVVIGGWKPGSGRRGGVLGSLLLGIPGEGGLEYVGKVGTGFTDQALGELTLRLAALERADSPFAGKVPAVEAREAHWVEPKIVGEVRFGEWTRDGRLRHPAWRGIRVDKSPAEVVRES